MVAATGAERRSNRQLGLPRVGADEHEIRDVDAADEQHERDAALQHQQRRPHRLDALFLHAADVHRHTGPLGEGFQLRWAGIDVALLENLGLRIRLACRDARLQASEQLDADAVAALRIFRGLRPAQWHDELHPRVERLELPRRDANDLVGFVVDPDVLTENLRALLVLLLPVGLGQHDDLVGAGLVLILGEERAEDGLYAEDLEDLGSRADTRGTDDGVLFSDQSEEERPQPELLVGGRVLRVIHVEGDVGRHVIEAGLHGGRVELHDPLRLLVGKRLQHQRIDRREDRRGRTDAQRQRDQRRGGDPLGLPKEAQGLTEVSSGAVENAAGRRG